MSGRRLCATKTMRQLLKLSGRCAKRTLNLQAKQLRICWEVAESLTKLLSAFDQNIGKAQLPSCNFQCKQQPRCAASKDDQGRVTFQECLALLS
eukprot:1518270-Amphidinium_carterae.1